MIKLQYNLIIKRRNDMREFELQFTSELEDEWNSGARKKYINWNSFVYAKWRQHVRQHEDSEL